MTIQEAIGIMKIALAEVEWEYPMDYAAAFETAIEALEKQRMKTPNYESDGYWNGELVYDTWICPCCSKAYEVDYDNYKYCPECGQAISWEGEE